MVRPPRAAGLILAIVCSSTFVSAQVFEWSELSPLPAPGSVAQAGIGVAAPFVGVSGGALIVAGGANFPGGLWLDGERNPDAEKVWWPNTFLLESARAEWREIEPLTRPLAYGSSISDSIGVVCIGGSDADRHYDEVFALRWDEGKLSRRDLPPLPSPCAFSSAVLVGRTVYVAGGLTAPDSTAALHNFWALDLEALEGRDPNADPPAWRSLEPWPGPPRFLAVAGVQAGAIIVASGAELVPGVDGKPTRNYLADAYRFDPDPAQPGGGAWRSIASPPRPVVAAPSPMAPLGADHLLVVGGDDGALASRTEELADRHPGFSRRVLAYHLVTDRWVELDEVPAGHVTASLVRWEDRLVIPSGEIRPGVRSPAVLAAAIVPREAGFHTLDYVAIFVYLAALVALGVYFSRREHSTADFFLAGRRIPWWAAGVSVFGTQLSAITFMAAPALVYRTDWVYFVGNMCIVLAAPFVICWFLPFYRRLDVTSVYEYLERRFSPATRSVGSVSFVLLQLGRMGIVLYLPALALASVTGTDVTWSILVMGILATAYTVLGGIEAVVWTDVIQVVVLLGGALLSVVVIVEDVPGGFGGIVEAGSAAGKFHMVNWTGGMATTAIWVVLLGRFFEQFVPYTADQTVVQRYLTTKDERAAARGIWTNAVLTIPATILFFFLGTALWAFYRTNPERLNPAGGANDILPWFVAQELPAGVAGVVIAGLFAASMSSLDSSMNSVATVLTTDFYRRWRVASEEHYLRAARWLTLVLGALGTGSAMLMAALGGTSMWDQYTKVIGLFGGGLAGLFIAGIFVRRASAAGALAGFGVSGAVLYFVRASGAVHFFLYPVIAIASCVVTAYVVGRVAPGAADRTRGLTVYSLDRS